MAPSPVRAPAAERGVTARVLRLHLTVPGVPVPKGRARTMTSAAGKTHTYTPQRTEDAETAMGWAMRNARLEAGLDGPLEGPLRLLVQFSFAMPESWSEKRKKATYKTAHIQRPDLDNLVKLVKDAGNGILWVDDSLIWGLAADKVWADIDETYISVAQEAREQ